MHWAATCPPTDAAPRRYPKDVRGFIPFQCYVLRDGGQFLMLDGGFRSTVTKFAPAWKR